MNLILIGNPGTGKSTLLNSLVGETAFKSGVSFGEGMTQVLQVYPPIQKGSAPDPKVNYYMDTPGLEDINIREKAAKEIEEGLKKGNGKYKIVFVCTQEAGRVRPSDITTILTVTNAINVSPLVYGILINKVPSSTLKALEKKENYEKFVAPFGKIKVPFNSIGFVPLNQELNDQDDVLIDTPPEVKKFLLNLPFCNIPSQSVKKVETKDYDKQMAVFEGIIAEMKKSNKALQDSLNEMKLANAKQINLLQEELKKQEEKQKREAREKNRLQAEMKSIQEKLNQAKTHEKQVLEEKIAKINQARIDAEQREQEAKRNLENSQKVVSNTKKWYDPFSWFK